MTFRHLKAALLVCMPLVSFTQTLYDDFEGNRNIADWNGDACEINTYLVNPFQSGINTSTTVMEYDDLGGQYANVRFQGTNKFDLSTDHQFSFKIYVPQSGLTGNQPNQVSFKLQDGTLEQPWTTQAEIIKPILLNQWQTVTFNFKTDSYANFDPNSSAPAVRKDFDRVLIQVNGENNFDKVIAYIDDFTYNGDLVIKPTYDNLIWSDEFTTNGSIDATKWHHQTKLPTPGGWFNNEVQHYTNRQSNSYVNNGILNIVARKETFSDQGVIKKYTSARLNSKFAFKYGKVEVRAKLPSGLGTWPAIWTLGKNISETGGYWQIQGFGNTGWPACGEIDIMEHWGYNQNFVQSAIHTPSSYGGTVNKGGRFIPTVSNDFHIYGFEWTADKLVFTVDDIVHYTYAPVIKDASSWPFDDEQYLLLNFAIQDAIDPNFTQGSMEIDYVRVYQATSTSSTKDNKKYKVGHYPNPVTDHLNISLDLKDNQGVEIDIYSIDGQLISASRHKVYGGNITLDNVSSLRQGMYIVSCKWDSEVVGFKFIKN